MSVHLDDPELVKAYEQSLETTRQIGRALRARRARIQSIINAVKAGRDERPIAPGLEHRCHDYCPPPAEMCAGCEDEPPGREL